MQLNNDISHIPLLTKETGFTLIETMIAIFILTVGIFSLYSMQTTSIRYNASSNAVTTSSTWAADRIEQLLALDYDDPLLADDDNIANTTPTGTGNDQAGLNHTSGATDTPDGRWVSPDQRYTLYWNVANQMTPNPKAPNASTVKAIRVIVQHTDYSIRKEVVMNYYKQKIF